MNNRRAVSLTHNNCSFTWNASLSIDKIFSRRTYWSWRIFLRLQKKVQNIFLVTSLWYISSTLKIIVTERISHVDEYFENKIIELENINDENFY